MDWQARNADFVMAAYALTAVMLVGLAAATLWRARRARKEAARLK